MIIMYYFYSFVSINFKWYDVCHYYCSNAPFFTNMPMQSSIAPYLNPMIELCRLTIVFRPIVVTILLLVSATATAASVNLAEFREGTVGKYINYFQEKNATLTIEEAQYYFVNSMAKKGSSNSISLGIDVAPVWLKFSVNNPSSAALDYRMAIETPWLDYIDTWLVRNGKIVRHVAGGDSMAFEDRPMQYRFYAFEHAFNSGKTDIYIRIETAGPLAIPVRLSSIDKAIQRDISAAYEYGVLYGIMSALALYNLVLFVFVRQKEYGLYGLYLLGFVLNSLSYTGQLHTIITPDFGPYFQDWLDIFLMITYSVAGLHFARALLSTKDYAPSLDKFVVRTTLVIPAGMLLGFVFNQLFFSMVLAFILNTCFVTLFVAMGYCALKAHKPFAVIFMLSSVTAAICITVSTLAVAGFLVPYNDYTFKAIEVGMAVEAILLAVILARQFRLAQMDKLIAETYARTDTLTQINNRRGFKDMALPRWQQIVGNRNEVSIVLLDIDFFKRFNDLYGHEVGDKVLVLVADCIAKKIRTSDIVARWGGEEFIIFLPETDKKEAAQQAELMRVAIEQLEMTFSHVKLNVTASFGVAGSEQILFNGATLAEVGIEPLINQADRALCIAKQNGKNQVYDGV